MTHICVSDLTIIGSDNGLSPVRRQAIIRTNAGILLIRPLGTNFSEILIEIIIFSFTKIRLKVSGLWQQMEKPCYSRTSHTLQWRHMSVTKPHIIGHSIVFFYSTLSGLTSRNTKASDYRSIVGSIGHTGAVMPKAFQWLASYYRRIQLQNKWSKSDIQIGYIGGILTKGPYLPCISMAGRALLAG